MDPNPRRMNRCGSALFMPQLFFGKSPATGELLSRAERFARTREPILLLGEPGTGKTAPGPYLHNLSGRSGPFVSVPFPSSQQASSIPSSWVTI
jgi:DNA-binding NtrC family response regulator